MEVIHAGLPGQPLRQPLEAQQLLRGLLGAPLLVCDHHQRMVVAAMEPSVGDELVGIRLGHDAVRDEGLEHLGEREAVILNGALCWLHGWNIATPFAAGKRFDFAEHLRDACRLKTRTYGDRYDHQSRRHPSRRQAFRIDRIRRASRLPDQSPRPSASPKRRKGKKLVIFALPGAYTPTCSAKHVPSYVKNFDALKAKKVDEIWCVATNDAFVMAAWGRDQKATGQDSHARRRQRRLDEEARPGDRPHVGATWACARSATRCWSRTAW